MVIVRHLQLSGVLACYLTREIMTDAQATAAVAIHSQQLADAAL